MQVNWSDDFGSLYKQRGQQKHGVRLLALWKIQEGMTETKVCNLLGTTPKTVRSWRQSYERGGLDELLSIKPGRGRKARIYDKESLAQDITELENQLNGGRIRCQDIVDYVAKKHKIRYSRSGMYHVLHRLGFSWITGRSKHPNHNEEDIQNFKKKLHDPRARSHPN